MRKIDDHNVIEELEEMEFIDEVDDETDHMSATDEGLSQEEIKDTGSVYTPPALVNSMLSELDYDFDNHDHTKTWLDPTVGSGAFVVELAKKGIKPKNIFGVDIMPGSVEMTKKRLREIFLKNGESLEDINFHLERNIICANALNYHYDFFEHDEMDEW